LENNFLALGEKDITINKSAIAVSIPSGILYTGLVENNPDKIEVKNALPRFLLIEGDELTRLMSNDSVPVSNLRYLLSWGNSLQINKGESFFDVPNSEALLDMMSIQVKISLEKETDLRRKRSGVKNVPLAAYQKFLKQFHTNPLPDRKTILTKLDEFVGQYM